MDDLLCLALSSCLISIAVCLQHQNGRHRAEDRGHAILLAKVIDAHHVSVVIVENSVGLFRFHGLADFLRESCLDFFLCRLEEERLTLLVHQHCLLQGRLQVFNSNQQNGVAIHFIAGVLYNVERQPVNLPVFRVVAEYSSIVALDIACDDCLADKMLETYLRIEIIQDRLSLFECLCLVACTVKVTVRETHISVNVVLNRLYNHAYNVINIDVLSDDGVDALDAGQVRLSSFTQRGDCAGRQIACRRAVIQISAVQAVLGIVSCHCMFVTLGGLTINKRGDDGRPIFCLTCDWLRIFSHKATSLEIHGRYAPWRIFEFVLRTTAKVTLQLRCNVVRV